MSGTPYRAGWLEALGLFALTLVLGSCGPTYEEREQARETERQRVALATFAESHSATPVELFEVDPLAQTFTAQLQQQLEGKVIAFRSDLRDIVRVSTNDYELVLGSPFFGGTLRQQAEATAALSSFLRALYYLAGASSCSAPQRNAEATRVRDTCPEKTYRMPDAEYSMAVTVLHDLASTVTVFALENALRGLAALGVLSCFRALDDAQQAKQQLTDSVLEEAVRAYQESIARYKGVYAAWEQFCAGVGVDAMRS